MARLGWWLLHMSRYPAPTIHPPRGSLPVLISVPHAGREYDESVLSNALQGLRSLTPLEDPLVDRLCWRAISAGFGAVVQNVPRAVIDCNRGEEEVDPASVSGIGPAPVGPRARHGLGLIPSRTHRHGALWRRPIAACELERRIEQVHRPYHHALEEGLEQLRCRFGEALLLDCHSMPTRSGMASDIVIGDRHGESSANWLSAQAMHVARHCGFRVALNDPYAGGAIVARHGKPGLGVHALQIEIDRSIYLLADGRSPSRGFDRIADLIETLATTLGEAILDRRLDEAAE